MASLVEEVSAELSEAELAQLDALIDEPETADVPEPGTTASQATAVAADVAPAAREGEQPAPRELAREFLAAIDGPLWHLTGLTVTLDENASFDALVEAREQAFAR